LASVTAIPASYHAHDTLRTIARPRQEAAEILPQAPWNSALAAIL
jgi:hypothetical protein